MTLIPRRRSGSAAIEFALWLPVLLLFVSTIVDYGYYMNQRVEVVRATMEACRTGAAIFEPNQVAPGSVIKPTSTARAGEVLTKIGIACPSAACNITVIYCKAGDSACGNAPFDAVQVEINDQFKPLIGLIPTPSRIDEKLIMAVENQRTKPAT